MFFSLLFVAQTVGIPPLPSCSDCWLSPIGNTNLLRLCSILLSVLLRMSWIYLNVGDDWNPFLLPSSFRTRNILDGRWYDNCFYVTVSYCLLSVLAYLRARTVHLCSFIEVSFVSSAKKEPHVSFRVLQWLTCYMPTVTLWIVRCSHHSHFLGSKVRWDDSFKINRTNKQQNWNWN